MFSKSLRSQLITLDITDAIMIALLKSKAERKAEGVKHQFERKTWRCIDRISNRILLLRETIMGGQAPVLGQKQYNRYQKIMKKVMKLLIDQNVSSEHGFDLVESLNSALCLVEDREKETKEKKVPTHKDWGMLHQSLFTLYKHIDSDLTETDRMRLGENLSQRIMGVAA